MPPTTFRPVTRNRAPAARSAAPSPLMMPPRVRRVVVRVGLAAFTGILAFCAVTLALAAVTTGCP